MTPIFYFWNSNMMPPRNFVLSLTYSITMIYVVVSMYFVYEILKLKDGLIFQAFCAFGVVNFGSN